MINWELELRNATEQEFEEFVDDVEQTMKHEISSTIKNKADSSGTLEGSIYQEKQSDLEYFVGVDGRKVASKNGFDYSKAFLKGRGEVRPKNKKVLAFKTNGQMVFTKKARATKPNDFIGRTVNKYR